MSDKTPRKHTASSLKFLRSFHPFYTDEEFLNHMNLTQVEADEIMQNNDQKEMYHAEPKQQKHTASSLKFLRSIHPFYTDEEFLNHMSLTQADVNEIMLKDERRQDTTLQRKTSE